ncbi:MAG: DUF2335 domain-containing protein [Desulfomonilaceae bacterium]
MTTNDATDKSAPDSEHAHDERADAARRALEGDAPASVLAAWYGPLPPPQVLAEFDRVIPGGAERILALAERQAAHRQNLERKEQALHEARSLQEFELSREALTKEFRIAISGVASAFALSMTTLILSFVAIFHGYSVEGSLLGGGAIAALVGAFIYGSRMKKQSPNTFEETAHTTHQP